MRLVFGVFSRVWVAGLHQLWQQDHKQGEDLKPAAAYKITLRFRQQQQLSLWWQQLHARGTDTCTYVLYAFFLTAATPPQA